MNTTHSLSQHIFSMCGPTLTLAAVSLARVPIMRGLQSLLQSWLLKHNRSGQTYENFACFFAGQGIPEPLLEGTYRILSQRSFRFPARPIDPLDPLLDVYGLDCYRGDELADLMNVLRKSCQLDFCNPVPAFLPCQTVEDLVYLLAARCDAVYLPTDRSCPATTNERNIAPKISSEWA